MTRAGGYLFAVILTVAAAVDAPGPAWAADGWLSGLPRFHPVDAAVQAGTLGPGINIMSQDRFFEAAQGARFKERYFGEIVARGFRTVRVPQAAFVHADSDGPLDPVWLAKLDWVVREATANGLNVIIDNNGGCSAQGMACLDQATRIWRNLAFHYRRLPNTVLFELYNEPDGAITPQIWNAGVVRMLAAVRASNPTRNIVIGTAHAYNVRDLAELELPTYDRHIIATFHYYEPYSFTHQGAPFLTPAKRPLLGAHFGTDADIALINSHFDYAAAWAAWYHRPVLLGEFGTLETADLSDRVTWTRTVARAAETHGLAWIYWQFDGDFTVYDTAHDAWVEPLARALIP